MRLDRLGHELQSLPSDCARWAADHLDELSDADPSVPNQLNDRASDNWRPLLSIATVAGCEWSERAQQAAQTLSGASREELSVGVQLLDDIRKIIGEKDGLFTDNLLRDLHKMEDRPWPEWGRSRKPITAVALARLLKRFEVKPQQIRIGDETKKGYKLTYFDDAFLRYLPADPKHPKQLNNDRASEGIPIRNIEEECFGSESAEKPITTGIVSGVSTQQDEWGEV